jgi:hypothetical protein
MSTTPTEMTSRMRDIEKSASLAGVFGRAFCMSITIWAEIVVVG